MYEELENIACWVKGFEPHNVLEIGTTGVTFFVLATLSTGRKACVDIRDVRPKIHNFMYGEDWQFFHGDSHSDEVFAQVQSFCSSFDLILIDGDHSYEGVERDFLMYRRLLSERGVILFHDVDPEHVFKGRFAGEVERFWRELDVGVKTVLYTTRSSGRIRCLGEPARFGGIGIWRPNPDDDPAGARRRDPVRDGDRPRRRAVALLPRALPGAGRRSVRDRRRPSTCRDRRAASGRCWPRSRTWTSSRCRAGSAGPVSSA